MNHAPRQIFRILEYGALEDRLNPVPHGMHSVREPTGIPVGVYTGSNAFIVLLVLTRRLRSRLTLFLARAGEDATEGVVAFMACVFIYVVRRPIEI